MSYAPDYPAPRPSAVTSRTIGPGIFLLVLGVLNLLYGGMLVFGGVQIAVMGPEERVKALGQSQSEEQKKQLQQANITPEQLVNIALGVYFGLGIPALLAGVIMAFGGLGMILLRWRGMAIFAAVLALIPCLSATSCILIGLGAGIWALVVLANPEVKAAFNRTARAGLAGEGPAAYPDENQY
jgi:hypothetical protein